MVELVLFLIAFMITIPIVSTVGVYFTLKYLYKNSIKALHKAVNWTTILYILAVNTLLTYLFDSFYIGYLVVFILCILTILILLQWKNNSEIDYGRAFKLLWRLCFLIFFLLYVILVIYGIIHEILI